MGECVERRSFHLARQYVLALGRFDGFGGLAEWRIRRPARTDEDLQAPLGEGFTRQCHKSWIGFGIFPRSRVVIARTFIAQGAIDDHEVWRLAHHADLAPP